MAGERQWLDVPYAEKDAAKSAGARWDGQTRCWYVGPRGDMAGLVRWWPLPAVLPGEDRGFAGGLFVDLVPGTCWFTNVRSCVEPRDWQRLKRLVSGRASECCEACGARPARVEGDWLEAHERWAYDDATQVQRLVRLVALCTACHRATHIGLAELNGYGAAARAQLGQVNGWTADQVEAHIANAFEWWQWRSTRTWTLDLAMLTSVGINVAPPGDGRHRADTAAQVTARVRGLNL